MPSTITNDAFAGANPAAPIKSLPLLLRRHRFELRQVERSGRVAIYSQSRAGRVVAFEVVLIRVRKAPRFGDRSPQMASEDQRVEQYASDSDWGRCGWTFSLYGGAVSRGKALQQAQAKASALSADWPTSG